MVTLLRRLAIDIVEEVEEHVILNEKPFDEEAWYLIEDTITEILLQRIPNLLNEGFEVKE